LDALEVQDDIAQKQRMVYAIDYNKELNNQLKERINEYEDILGIETLVEIDWEAVQKERERFFRFMGFNAWL
jgi:predicted aldo/keto reductase-like oxidoreductase